MCDRCESCNVAGQAVESWGYESPQPNPKGHTHVLDWMAQLRPPDPHLSAAYQIAVVDTSSEFDGCCHVLVGNMRPTARPAHSG